MEIAEPNVIAELQGLLLRADVAVSNWSRRKRSEAADALCRTTATRMMEIAKQVGPDVRLAGELVCASHYLDALLDGVRYPWRFWKSEHMLRRLLEKRGGRNLDLLARTAVWNGSLQSQGWVLKAAETHDPLAGGLGKGDLALLPLNAIAADTNGQRRVWDHRTTAVVLGTQPAGYVGIIPCLSPFAEVPLAGSIIGFRGENVLNTVLNFDKVDHLVNPSDLRRVLDGCITYWPDRSGLGALTYAFRRRLRLQQWVLAEALGIDRHHLGAWEFGRYNAYPQIRKPLLRWLRQQIRIHLPERAKGIQLPEA